MNFAALCKDFFGNFLEKTYLLPILLMVAAVITGWLLLKNSSTKSVAQILAALSKEYTVFSDVTISSHMGISQIEHIVVSKHGIFIITEKDYSGEITGKETDQYWVHTLGKKKSRLFNPVRQNNAYIKALEALFVPLSKVPCISIVVFSDKCRFKEVIPGVTNYRGLMAEIKRHDKNLLTSAEISLLSLAIKKANISEGKDAERA